jgi:hypothetical protein
VKEASELIIGSWEERETGRDRKGANREGQSHDITVSLVKTIRTRNAKSAAIADVVLKVKFSKDGQHFQNGQIISVMVTQCELPQ